MIIGCPKCKKRFEIPANLIPDQGRLLQCSSCSHKWFFQKDTLVLTKETNKKKDLKTNNEEIPKEVEKIINQAEKFNEKIHKSKKISFFNILLVLIITFIALIILLDTFKETIDTILPGSIFLLDNFYETIIDIFLFFKDLIR